MHSTAVREQLLDMRKIVLPYRHSAGISRPVLAELLESLTCLLDIHRAIDGFELFREAPPFLAWNIANGVADEMHDAPLHDHLREDCFGAVFEPCHTIHGEEADFLQTACFELVENLHPGMLTLDLVDPKPQHVLAAFRISYARITCTADCWTPRSVRSETYRQSTNTKG